MSSVHDVFLRFTSDVSLADLVMTSITADPVSFTYFFNALVGLEPMPQCMVQFVTDTAHTHTNLIRDKHLLLARLELAY